MDGSDGPLESWKSGSAEPAGDAESVLVGCCLCQSLTRSRKPCIAAVQASWINCFILVDFSPKLYPVQV